MPNGRGHGTGNRAISTDFVAVLAYFEAENIWATPASCDSHQHHFSETPVFAGCGVRAVGTNESNTYRRTQRKNTVFRSANQYSRTQPITCRKWRFLNCRGAVGRLENGFSAIHTDTNIGIISDNVYEMTHFSG